MKVAVFGLGYVGTVTAACLAANGHDVYGVDVDAGKVATIASGASPVQEPGLTELVAQVVAAGNLRATTSPAVALRDATVSILCVGTPSAPHGGTDLSYLYRAIDEIAIALTTAAPRRVSRHAVMIRSTVPPGTVEGVSERLRLAIDGTGPLAGVAMCPEFLREGSGITDFYAPPYTVVGTSDAWVATVVSDLFSFIVRPVRIVDPRTAEALKYACNAFHATKVSFANELGRIFHPMEVDPRLVMQLFCEDDQLNISPRYLRPGFAFGGSCLGKDLRALLHAGRMRSVDLPVLSATLASNARTIADVVDRIVSGPGHTIALLGLSFKAGSDDLRESPYVDLAETLLGKGYGLQIYDPIVNPASLIGSNRHYVESKLPHLHRILTDHASVALAGADVAIVSCARAEVIGGLVAAPPARIIDLDGRLGQLIEQLPGYEGIAW